MPQLPASAPAAANASAPPSEPMKSPRLPAGMIGGALAGVIVLGIGVFLLVRPGTPSTPLAQPAPAPTAPSPKKAPVTPPSLGVQPRGVWTFDQLKGRTFLDSSGCGNDTVLHGDGSAWTKDGKVGAGAFLLDGSTYAEAAGPVINTAQSFTVAAWVKFFELQNNRCETVLSVDGNEVSGFYLQYSIYAGNRLVFNRLASDSANGKPKWAKSGFIPATNIWYHLAGVYNADAHTIALYVNGMLQQTASFTNAWPATGKLAIGRGYFQHKADMFHSVVDDVQVYDSALTESQIRLLAFQ
ncbi:MAG TPA: LamG domain-containing protein [Verrucomicrobiae bacterium]